MRQHWIPDAVKTAIVSFVLYSGFITVTGVMEGLLGIPRLLFATSGAGALVVICVQSIRARNRTKIAFHFAHDVAEALIHEDHPKAHAAMYVCKILAKF